MLLGIEFHTKKSASAYVYPPPQWSWGGGEEGVERHLYYNVEKRETRFTLGLDTAKNTHHIKKRLK